MQSEVILYVPTLKRLAMDHELVRILGWNDAERLCKAFGGEILRPASCAEVYRRFRDSSIESMLRTGMTATSVAAIFGVSDRHVRGIGKEIPREEIPTAANDNAPIRKKARAANGKPN